MLSLWLVGSSGTQMTDAWMLAHFHLSSLMIMVKEQWPCSIWLSTPHVLPYCTFLEQRFYACMSKSCGPLPKCWIFSTLDHGFEWCWWNLKALSDFNNVFLWHCPHLKNVSNQYPIVGETLENVAWLSGRVVLDVEAQGRHSAYSLCIQVDYFSSLVDLACVWSGGTCTNTRTGRCRLGLDDYGYWSGDCLSGDF
jgi:hypothetical protein